MTYGTTEQFLTHFGFNQIEDLTGPDRAQGRAACSIRTLPLGLLRCRTRAMPQTSAEDEDPLEDEPALEDEERMDDDGFPAAERDE